MNKHNRRPGEDGAAAETEQPALRIPDRDAPDPRADSRLTRAAVDLHRLGRVPVPLGPGTKRPSDSGWQHQAYVDEDAVRRDFAAMAPGAGLGIRLGGGLADVDLDTETARRAAPFLLPNTPARSGRPGAPCSHRWFRVDADADAYVKHTGPDGSSVVELRATPGHQTVVPPSVHPSGEPYQWEEGCTGLGEAAEVSLDDLRAAVASVALVAVLADAWPDAGSRHDAFLALAGALLRDGGHESPALVSAVEAIVSALATLTGDEEARVRVAEAVPSTAAKLAAGQPATGWTRLGELLAGADPAAAVRCAQRAADTLRDALRVPRVTVELDHGPTEAEAEAFWAARPLLAAVRDFARARRVGPWALLGAVLARAAASVPPSVVLPPTRGADASLNVFVALCGESGSGKSATMEAAREFLDATGGTADFLETSPGSGEGLLAAYVYNRQERGKAPEVVQIRLSVLLDADEVGSLGALAARTNSTLLPFLKSAWVGRPLGTQNAEAARLRRLGAHRYRLAVVAGVQPARAGAILDDEAGGFPQRWLWLPTYDPGMLGRGVAAPEPPPWAWPVPAPRVEVDDEHGVVSWPLRRSMTLPDEAVSAILDAAEAQNRPIGARARAGESAGLDGHALLSRAKVAALLALLDGRGEAVTAEDWQLSGVVLAVSDRTRAAVIRARTEDNQRAEDRRAARVGRSAAIAADSQAETHTVRCMAAIRRKLTAPEVGEGTTANALGKALGGRHKPVLTDALARLVESGEVAAAEAANANNVAVIVYRLAVRP